MLAFAPTPDAPLARLAVKARDGTCPGESCSFEKFKYMQFDMKTNTLDLI